MSNTWTMLACWSARGQPRLVQEHRDELLVLGERRQDALDGDVLLEPAHRFGDAAEHLRHAAGRNPFGDAISTIGHRSPVPAGRYREKRQPRQRLPTPPAGSAAGRPVSRLTPQPEP
jgi:hypothetical protein